jgi:hypothetical protein
MKPSQSSSSSSHVPILQELAPQLMQSKILSSSAFSLGSNQHSGDGNTSIIQKFSPLGKSVSTSFGLRYDNSVPLLKNLPSSRILDNKQSYRGLALLEQVGELLSLPVPSPTLPQAHLLQDSAPPIPPTLPLIRGFSALLPSQSSSTHRTERKKRRDKALGINATDKLGLIEISQKSRGLLSSSEPSTSLLSPSQKKGNRRAKAGRFSLTGSVTALGELEEEDGFVVVDPVMEKEELEREVVEINGDLEGLAVRRVSL